MRLRRGFAVLFLPICWTAAGCAAPPIALHPGYQTASTSFFVARATGDDSAMEEEIAAELRKRGLDASAGSYENLPADADVLVLYRDSWWMNILAKGEMLVLELRDARTGATIASAEQRWISHIGDVPDQLVSDVVTQALGTPAAGDAPSAAQRQ